MGPFPHGLCSSISVVILPTFTCASFVALDRNVFFPSGFYPYCLNSASWHSIHAHNFNEICPYFSISDFCIMRNLSVSFCISVNAIVLGTWFSLTTKCYVAALCPHARHVSNQSLLATVSYDAHVPAPFTPDIRFPLWPCLHKPVSFYESTVQDAIGCPTQPTHKHLKPFISMIDDI